MKTFSRSFTVVLLLGALVSVFGAQNQTQTDLVKLSSSEKEGLLLMREEEKLALDVYTEFGKIWGGRPFSNIVRAEQMHMNSVGDLLKTYGLHDPIKGLKPGEFSNAKLKKLYLEMISTGKKSRIEALRIGATIEDLDLYDLQKLSKETTRPDILKVYEFLINGSKNHMRAFVNNLQKSGETYKARYISAEELDLILNGG